MKIALIILLLLAALTFKAQNRPFPQSINYPGCIKPHLEQETLNKDVASYYDYWKSQYLKKLSNSLPSGYYIAGENTGSSDGFVPLGSSEGMGYGMVITSLMGGYDIEAQLIFDRLFRTVRAYKSKSNPNLMGWVVDNDKNARGHFSSATDGDMDIAYSLLMAHYQWGSAGKINYRKEALRVIIDGLKASNVTSDYRLNLGDWDKKDAYNTRPSDWMMSHMRAFFKETGDTTWLHIISNLYNVYNIFSDTYSPATGLVTDFIVGNPPKPCPPNFLDEYPETNTYSYNACRFPLRIVMDYAMYGSKEAFLITGKLCNWVRQITEDDPAEIKNGYRLDGIPAGNGADAVFISPFVAASVTDSKNQDFLNKGWEIIKNKKDSYYSDSFNLLCMLFISGNWWKPEFENQ